MTAGMVCGRGGRVFCLWRTGVSGLGSCFFLMFMVLPVLAIVGRMMPTGLGLLVMGFVGVGSWALCFLPASGLLLFWVSVWFLGYGLGCTNAVLELTVVHWCVLLLLGWLNWLFCLMGG